MGIRIFQDKETIEANEKLQHFLEKIPVRIRMDVLEDSIEFCKVSARDYLWKKIKRRSLSLLEVAEVVKVAKSHGFTLEAFKQAAAVAEDLNHVPA